MKPSPSNRLRTQGSTRRRVVRNRLAEAQNWRCAYCQCSLEPETATTDHVIPLAGGGSNYWLNMVAACEPCNRSKRDMALFAEVSA